MREPFRLVLAIAFGLLVLTPAPAAPPPPVRGSSAAAGAGSGGGGFSHLGSRAEPNATSSGPAARAGGQQRRQANAAENGASDLPRLSSPAGEGPLPRLRRPGGRQGESRHSRSWGLSSILTTASGLAIVLGLFLAVAWLVRRATPAAMAPLPREVVEVLGRMPLAHQQHLQLVRFGDRLLLVAVSTAGAETLSEISDTDEVTRLVGLCRQSQPGSATQAFRQVFQQLAAQRHTEVRDE